jgi:hypothetical protein
LLPGRQWQRYVVWRVGITRVQLCRWREVWDGAR